MNRYQSLFSYLYFYNWLYLYFNSLWFFLDSLQDSEGIITFSEILKR